MRPFKNGRGVTLTEVMLACAISGLIFVAAVRYFSKVIPMMNRARVRQQVQVQSRQLMDTIAERLRNGKALTVAISTPPETPGVPNSRIDFVLQTPLASGATGYAIYLSCGTVYAQEFGRPPAARDPRALAKNVSSLMFTGSSNDPGLISISLQMDVSYDSTGDPSHVTSLMLPNQTVRMVETQ